VRSGKRENARAAKAGAPAKPSTSKPKPRETTRREPALGAAEEALRLAGGAAGAVLGTASSVTRGILRRLPKP
jgi:hypothetical protein